MKLLPGPKMDPVAVAQFLRSCPGLAKPAIGEVLGEKGPFYDSVREAFLTTFEFAGEGWGQGGVSGARVGYTAGAGAGSAGGLPHRL